MCEELKGERDIIEEKERGMFEIKKYAEKWGACKRRKKGRKRGEIISKGNVIPLGRR